MEIKISERLEKILGYARDEAMRTGSYAICVDHLTLALIRDCDNEACRILTASGVNPAELKDYIDSQIFSSRGVPFCDSSKVGISRGVESTVNLAAHEALKQGSTTVLPEHLLSAIIRSGASASRTFLSEIGVSAEIVSSMIAPADPEKEKTQQPKSAAVRPEPVAKLIITQGNSTHKIFS